MGSTCLRKKEVILPMDVLGYTGKLIRTRILSQVPAKHKNLFTFGLQAFSLKHFESLASNARQVIANTCTASSKVYRLVTNKTILNDFHCLVALSGLVERTSLVNVDFSTFCGFETLAFGVQTSLGRAIPIWIDAITYPIKQAGSQNQFIVEQVRLLGHTLGFYPALVFDRGFVIPLLIKFMIAQRITFYVRVKAGQHFLWPDAACSHKGKTAKKIGQFTKDTTISAYGTTLRLIISPPPPRKRSVLRQTPKERWYIITNDFTSKRKEILNIYRCRFEIEEVFKDAKHITKLKKFFRIKLKRTFMILLWFVLISFWLAFWTESLTKPLKVHLKKTRSWFKRWWEEFQRQLKEPGLQRLRLESG